MKGQSEYNYLFAELVSLGITSEQISYMSDISEIENFVDSIKQKFVQDYRSSYCYDDSTKELNPENEG
jgi:hypothetical protein